MKILNIHNILFAKSLGGFLPILQNFMLMSMECFPNLMDQRLGFPDAMPACTTTLLGDLQGCWNGQRQGMLRQIEKKRAQPSSSHTNLNRRGVGRRRVSVELSSFVICKKNKSEVCVSLSVAQPDSINPFMMLKEENSYLKKGNFL